MESSILLEVRRNLRGWASYMVAGVLAVLTPGCAEGTSVAKAGNETTPGSMFRPVTTLPPELSGCAVIDGGVLIVEDEAIGSVLLARDLGDATVPLELIKLERKKKERAPFADRAKLFPVQDFEDVASNRDEVVYFIGSHNGKGGERRPDREFLLRAEWDKKDSELKVVGENYRLLDQLSPALESVGCTINLTSVNVVEQLNIEGLAVHDEQLFIGFRSPLTSDDRAVLVRTNADGHSPVAMKLDLGGAGIRALDWDPKRERILIVSGPATDSGPAGAALWQCDLSGEKLEQILVFDDTVARKHPEGVCRLPDGRLLVVLDGEDGGSGSEIVFLDD